MCERCIVYLACPYGALGSQPADPVYVPRWKSMVFFYSRRDPNCACTRVIITRAEAIGRFRCSFTGPDDKLHVVFGVCGCQKCRRMGAYAMTINSRLTRRNRRLRIVTDLLRELSRGEEQSFSGRPADIKRVRYRPFFLGQGIWHDQLEGWVYRIQLSDTEDD